jgi:hypothetical protein
MVRLICSVNNLRYTKNLRSTVIERAGVVVCRRRQATYEDPAHLRVVIGPNKGHKQGR